MRQLELLRDCSGTFGKKHGISHPHPWRRIVRQGLQGLLYFRRIRLGHQDNGTLADKGIRITQSLRERRVIQRFQAGERIESMDFSQWCSLLIHERLERCNGRFVLPLIEQPRCGIPLPAIGVSECLHQFCRACFCNVASPLFALLPLPTFRHDAVDSAAVIAVVEVEVFFDFIRHTPGVLDDFAVHVADMEAAVGSIGKVHHAHPGVLACGKLKTVFIRRAFADEVDAVFSITNDFAMNELAAGITGEAVVHKLRAIGIAAINGGAGGAGEVAAHTTAAFNRALDHAGDAPAGANDAPGFVGADAEHFRRATICRDAFTRRRHVEVGIARGIAVIIDPVLQVVRV